MPDWIKLDWALVSDRSTRGTEPEPWTVAADDLRRTFEPRADNTGRPVWVVLHTAAGGALSHVEVDVSAEGLHGWSAPPGCAAVGVVATGRVVSAGRPRRPGSSGVHRPIALGCVVSRTGVVGWSASPKGTLSGSAPEGGRILDCLKRCLGLPTPPEPGGLRVLVDTIWIAAVIEAARESPETLVSWDLVEGLHPAANRPHLACQGAGPTWEDIRLATADGAWREGPVAAELAGWMDEGMFARSVLERLPDVADLVAAASTSVTPGRRSAASRHISPLPAVARSSDPRDGTIGFFQPDAGNQTRRPLVLVVS